MKFKFVLLLFLVFSMFSRAEITLPKLISNGMVLQRDQKVKVWGWGNVGEKVDVQIDGKKYSTVANSDGHWSVLLKAHPAGGPFTMEIKGENTIVLEDILFGDVWQCSGQSNMELPMRRVKPLYEKQIRQADNPQIRFFNVPLAYDFKTPHSDYNSGSWQTVNKNTILEFSALAYFFADTIHKKYHVPVGIINASLGGSPAEAWMSEDALKLFPESLKEAYRWRSDELIKQTEENDRKKSNDWNLKSQIAAQGNDSTPWFSMTIPGYWNTDYPKFNNGVFVFKRTFNLQREDLSENAFLNMGRIVDADSVFINNKFIGTTTYQYPPRWYKVPEGVLREGENEIVVRVVSYSGKGGFVFDKPYELKSASRTINLKGEWKFRKACDMPEMESQTFIRWNPMGLYNAMISPLVHYAKKGIVWYQGESNTSHPSNYATLLTAMVKDWRLKYNQASLPFLYVQLPNFQEASMIPVESNWAELREQQRSLASLENSGMVVAIDLGEWNDIHPLNKKSVADRLAKLAGKLVYKEKGLTAEAPHPIKVALQGEKIKIQFSGKTQLTTTNKLAPAEFAVAGENGKFQWVNAEISADYVILNVENIPNPKVVRYAWANNPDKANLCDMDHNMVSPFQIKIKK